MLHAKPLCQLCGLRLARRRASGNTPAAPACLPVSTAPMAADWRLIVHVAPDAPLGFADVQLGMGKGSGGRGRRPLDDARCYADTLRRIANHLQAYAADYEAAAADDTAMGA